MAGFNEILVGRFNRFFQRFFGIKGPAAVAQLSSDVQPVIPIFSGVENRLLEGWRRYTQISDLGPVAGLTTAVRLRNPTASGVVGVVESWKVATSLNDVLNIRVRGGLTNVGLQADASTGGNPWERRIDTFGTLKYSTDIAGNQQGNFAGIIPTQARVAIELITFEDQEITIDPGQWVQIHTTVANTEFWSWVTWRERPIEEGELGTVFP
jgi:hypothetical protein